METEIKRGKRIVSVSSSLKEVCLCPEEIDYVEASDGKCYVYVRGEGYMPQMTLDDLEQELKDTFQF